MRVSLKWLRDYLDLDPPGGGDRPPADHGRDRGGRHPLPGRVLGQRLGGADREDRAPPQRRPPDPGHRHLRRAGPARRPGVQRGDGEVRRQRVVTGATNIKEGDVVPLGLVGTRYRDGHSDPPQERVLQPTHDAGGGLGGDGDVRLRAGPLGRPRRDSGPPARDAGGAAPGRGPGGQRDRAGPQGAGGLPGHDRGRPRGGRPHRAAPPHPHGRTAAGAGAGPGRALADRDRRP